MSPGIKHAMQQLSGTEAFYKATRNLGQKNTDNLIVSWSPSRIQKFAWSLRVAQREPVNKSESLARSHLDALRNNFGQRCAGAEVLAEDAYFLAQRFHQTFPIFPKLRFTLFFQMSGVEDYSPMVHQDGTSGDHRWRLVFPYDGPKTRWTPNDNIDMSTLQRKTLEAHVIDPSRIYPLPDDCAALMKFGNKGIFHSEARTKKPVPRSGLILTPML